ncbi:hypothetical protein tb265_00130 [Gemmatimonadetes bacterium T265]|nr:hypothetical protein tb265_00130 [Gemmatimonadetes bacterium T265]
MIGPVACSPTSADGPAFLEWFKAAAPLLVAGVVTVGGYRYGVRKTRVEGGFDKRISWYEDTLTAIDACRDARHRASHAERAWAGEAARRGDLAATWDAARIAAEALLRALRRAEIYADVAGRTAAAAAVAQLAAAIPTLVPIGADSPITTTAAFPTARIGITATSDSRLEVLVSLTAVATTLISRRTC